jgi:hypothetical protein
LCPSANQPYLIYNETIHLRDNAAIAERILVLMSQTGLDVLARCKQWYIDGTFKSVARTLFTQVLMVLGLTDVGKALPDKEKITYELQSCCTPSWRTNSPT